MNRPQASSTHWHTYLAGGLILLLGLVAFGVCTPVEADRVETRGMP